MPNTNTNGDFDLYEDGENISSLGFHEENEEEEELEEKEDDLIEESIEPEDGGETIFSAPIIKDRGIESSLEENDEEEEEEIEMEEGEEENEDEVLSEDDLIVSKKKIILARQLLESIKENSERLNLLFSGLLNEEEETRIGLSQLGEILSKPAEEAGNIIEGVFDGENMIGPDGKEYSVPPNYASKSKLVEGDMLKLTITDRGTFIYKQTKPIDRKRLIGRLEKDENGNFLVIGEKGKWHVLPASITYFKGSVGDKVVLLIPQEGESQWGAVENIIRLK